MTTSHNYPQLSERSFTPQRQQKRRLGSGATWVILFMICGALGVAKSSDMQAPPDEAQGGRTTNGTEITTRTEKCFPAENRNVFSKMDMIADPASGTLAPLNFDLNGD